MVFSLKIAAAYCLKIAGIRFAFESDLLYNNKAIMVARGVNMVGSPKLRVTKYFGAASVQKMELSLEEAKSNLGYFWTPDGGSNIIVSVEGQTIKSYEELLAVAAKDKYKNLAFIDVGLFLSNDGYHSIWNK
jgi:hypothetical protein